MQTRQRLCGDLSGESESRIDLPSAGPFYRKLQRSWYLLSMTAVFQFACLARVYRPPERHSPTPPWRWAEVHNAAPTCFGNSGADTLGTFQSSRRLTFRCQPRQPFSLITFVQEQCTNLCSNRDTLTNKEP